jgi:hypothetical protein
MTTDRQFTVPRARLHLANGDSFVVSITNADRLQWDLTAPRKKWGKATEVPVLAQTFIGYVAAKREKHTDLSWDQFQEQLIGMEDVDEEPAVIRPTRTGASDGLS